MLNFNDAPAQRPDGVIPDGTYVRLQLTFRPGEYHGAGLEPGDDGLLRASKSSDAIMLDCEFTVLTGTHKGRKVWSYWTVMGGTLDDKGHSKGFNVTKQTMRAVLNSATGTFSSDNSPAAQAKRTIPNFSALHGVEFAARLGIEDGGDYPDKNVIAHVVEPDEPEWQAVMNGEEIPPKPGKARRAAREKAPELTPAWQRNAAPAQAQPQAWGGGTPAPVPNGAGGPQTQPMGQAGAAVPASGPSWMRG